MFRLIIKLAIVGLLIYAAVGVGLPFVRYWQLQDAMREAADYADTPSISGRRATPDQILDRLSRSAKEIGLPLDRDDFQIRMDRSSTVIDVRYSAQLEYFPRRYYPYEFAIHTEGTSSSRYRAAVNP